MLPAFLLAETEIIESGVGTAFDLAAFEHLLSQQLSITLGITDIQQRHSLELAILGSEDGAHWLYPPLGSFSQKFYCGTYRLILDLKLSPSVRYLLPRWKLNRCGYSPVPPLFGVYLTIETVSVETLARGVA